MTHNLQSAVLILLHSGKDWIFDDESGTLEEVFGLTEKLFDEPNKHLTDNERASIRAMIEAIEKRKTSDARYKVLEGKSEGGWSAGRAALKKWFQKQQVTSGMRDRIDEVYNNLGVAPMQLINEGLEEGEDFPNIIESERAKEDVLLAIAGDHALERVPRGDFRDALTSINHHAWERHRKRFRRAEKGLPNKKLAAAVTVKEIEDADEVTASQLREATKAVKALSMAVAWFPAEQDQVAEYQEFLKEVVVVAVAKARKVPKEKVTVKTDNTPGRKRGAQRARKVKTASLVAAGDVEEIWALYVQLFETQPGQLEPVQDEEDLENSGKAAWLEQSEDLGVDGWREMDNDKLNHLLQFPGGKPALFAEFRSKRGLCAWDEASTSKFVEENEDMEPLSLLWHQRVGVAAIVDKIWSATKSDDEVPGILIADEVGVGKTALTMGLIAFVIDAFWVQEVAAGRGRPDGVTSTINMTNVRPAPILAERPFFAGLDAIPNLPHVIIVPNSLNSQWFSELRTFFAPKALEVYNYPTAENEFGDFFNGAWAKSSTPLIHRIILVNHSVMLTSGKVFDTRKGVAGHNSNKASDDTRSLKLRKQAAKCLWAGQKFLTVSVDEVHDMRNLTAQFYATLEVTRASIVKLLASGTPLYTGPMDLCNVGRLARIPYFMGKSGDERDKEHVKQLRAARRTMTQEDKNDAAAHTVRLLAGSATTNDDEPEARIRIRDATTKWINNIKRGYRGRVIRRTVDSQTFDGKKINDTLIPYKMVIVPVQLNEKELEINESVMAQITGSSMAAALDDTSNFNTKFYLDGRTKVVFPHHQSPTYPVVKSLAEWDTVRSTKVDTLIKLLAWHLQSDEHDTFNIDEESAKGVSPPPSNQLAESLPPRPNAEYIAMPDLMTRGTRKILVYIEFPMMAPLLISLLKLHNINPLIIHGGHGAEERNETVLKFHSDPNARILIFSSVGAVGLNLTAATVVVLFDQCWSRMLVNQIIGRAWRLGQQKEVVVYNMVALGTVDVLMLHHGEGKGNMLKQFLTANKGLVKSIKSGLAGHEPIHDDDDDEVEFIDPPAPTPGPSKSRKKAVKGGKKRVTRNIAQTGDEDGDILDLDNMVLTDADGHEDEGDNGETGKGKGKAKAKGKGKASAKPKPKPKPKVKGKGKGKATVEDDESEGDVVVVEGDDQNKARKWFIELTPLANRPAAGQTAETTSGPLTETAVGDTASSTMDTAGLTGEGDGSQKEGGSSSAAASSGGPPGEPDEQSATATPPAPSVSDVQSLVVASNASDTDGPRGEPPSLAASGQAAPHTEHHAGATPPSGAATNTPDIGPSSIQKGKSAETSIPDNNDMDVDFGNDGDGDGDVHMDTGGTQHSSQDKAAVDKMLADLTQSESNISNHPSSDRPSTPTPDAQVVQTSQPTQDLGTAAKRRRTPSSTTATPSAPPYAPSPPHKRVHVRSSNPSSPIGSPDQTTTGGAAMRNRSAVPHDAPGPRGRGRSSRGVSSRAGRGRGGRR